jgi:hypothetical protein
LYPAISLLFNWLRQIYRFFYNIKNDFKKKD